MIRKEKVHLSRSRARVREMEAQGTETEALLSGMKEDKVGPWVGETGVVLGWWDCGMVVTP